jgi:hypothetical protein
MIIKASDPNKPNLRFVGCKHPWCVYCIDTDAATMLATVEARDDQGRRVLRRSRFAIQGFKHYTDHIVIYGYEPMASRVAAEPPDYSGMPVIPPEVWNRRPIDSDRCAKATRALCG